MKKIIYYVNTNGYDFLMTDDGETRRVLSNEYAICPRDPDSGRYIGIEDFVKSVEDDSSWDEYTASAETLVGRGEVIFRTEIEL